MAPGNGTTKLLENLADLSRVDLAEMVMQERSSGQLLQERLWELELALEDEGWTRGDREGELEFSREAMQTIIGRCRLFYLQNPLINHAVEVQADYVFGQGVSITAKGTANDIMQAFLDDPRNLRTFSSHEAMLENEKRLPQEGNIFFALWTNPTTGKVVVRHVPVEQVLAGEIITNPDDKEEVWFYRRRWRQKKNNSFTGVEEWEDKDELYPDWRHRPRVRILNYGGKRVNWDAPIYHLQVGGIPGSHWGIPELYSSLSWARSVTEDLNDYATMRRAASRYAYLLNVKGGGPAVASAKSKLESTLDKNPDSRDANPPPTTASTWIQDPTLAALAAAPRVNTPNPDEGRRLGLMVAAGVGIPETILFGDADVGNLATAKTLDRPTELKFRNRQTLWSDVIRDIGLYVLMADARAPRGQAGPAATIQYDPDLGTEVLVPGNDPKNVDEDDNILEYDATVDVAFPSVLEDDAGARVLAVTTAAAVDVDTSNEVMPIRLLRRLLLEALEVRNVDEVLDDMEDLDAQREAEEAARAALMPEPPAVDELGNPLVPDPTQGDVAVPGQADPAVVTEALRAFTRTLQESRRAVPIAAGSRPRHPSRRRPARSGARPAEGPAASTG